MTQKELTDLTNEELLEKKKAIKSRKIIDATLIGLCIGITLYSAVKNGFGFFTFFPLFLAYLFFLNGKKIKAIEKELESRNL